MGEHGYWAKNYMPLYEEISHIPLFIWDPRYRLQGEKRKSLVQTIDLPVTLLGFFGVTVPKDMQGKNLADVLVWDRIEREAVLFGIHGAQVCCTDGRYVYMKAPIDKENTPLYEYTLMPAHMVGFFSETSLGSMQVSQAFDFTKDLPLMRFDSDSKSSAYQYGDLLFDLENDKNQMKPIQDAQIEARMRKLLIELMQQNDAPEEQYIRLGLNENERKK
ncbi:MAG: sulfatase/phosphatase domain-containing protein [Anaerocolumna sp.]